MKRRVDVITIDPHRPAEAPPAKKSVAEIGLFLLNHVLLSGSKNTYKTPLKFSEILPEDSLASLEL
jgi:hypothetical protein